MKWLLVALALAHAGLECHDGEIQIALDALEAVSRSSCRDQGKLKDAVTRLRELGFESSCDPRLVDRAKVLIRDLRIDAWVSPNEKTCAEKSRQAIESIRRLKARPLKESVKSE